MMLVIVACTSSERCARKYPPSVRDSVVIRDSTVLIESTIFKVVERDSIILVPGIKGEESMPCNENGKYVIRRGGDVFVIKINNGKVDFTYDLAGTVTAFSERVSEKDREIALLKNFNTTASHKEDRVIKVKEKWVPWYYKALSLIGVLSLAYFSIRLAIKFI